MMEHIVKPRYDGGGTEFGAIHRKLGVRYGMFDIDILSASANVNLEIKEQNAGFFEYRTDFQNSNCEFKALFELKFRWTQYVEDALNCRVGTATFAQLKLCEKLNCRFFFVVATEGMPPFHFYEINYNGTHEYIGELNYYDKDKDGASEIIKFWNTNLNLY